MLSVLPMFYFTCIFMHTGKGGYGSREKVSKEISGGWHGQVRELERRQIICIPG